jgi:hypothetical protein
MLASTVAGAAPITDAANAKQFERIMCPLLRRRAIVRNGSKADIGNAAE